MKIDLDDLCPDCGAKPGELHIHDCEDTIHDRLPWDGEWPGKKECREFDLWCRWGPPWIPCDRNHPDATEDLTRLDEVAAWDADARRYVRILSAK